MILVILTNFLKKLEKLLNSHRDTLTVPTEQQQQQQQVVVVVR